MKSRERVRRTEAPIANCICKNASDYASDRAILNAPSLTEIKIDRQIR